MSTIVYQELRSYYESGHYAEPRTLSLKLNNSSSKLVNFSHSPEANISGWSAIEALSFNSSSTYKREGREIEPVYVHPLVKRSSSMLSEKSLEMCTESLGCETGTTCVGELSSTLLFSPARKPVVASAAAAAVSCENKLLKKREKKNEVKVFPPPLTTISGSNMIRIQPYREHGRLVMKAVSGPPPTHSCLQAERSDGRLKLSLLRDCNYNNNSNSNYFDECCSSEDEESDCGSSEKDGDVRSTSEEAVEDMNGITLEFGVKLGMEYQFQRPSSRCKEGGRENQRLINWETFWVAT